MPGLRLGSYPGKRGSSYWTPQSLVVENAEPTKVVMTGLVANTSAVAGDFTIAGFTVSSLARDVTNKILTLTLSTAVVYGDFLTVVYKGKSYVVTNNVEQALENPSALQSLITSPLTMNLIWADPSVLGDGIKIYLSTNGGATYTYNSTVANGVQAKSLTGLTAGTTYTIKIISYDGAVESSGITDTNITASYLTSNTIGAKAESYNSGKGFRKKTTEADGWESVDSGGVLFVETLGIGEKLIVKVDDCDLAFQLDLSTVLETSRLGGNAIDIYSGVYSGYGLTEAIQFAHDGAFVSGTQAVSDGVLLRLDYSGNFIHLDYSSNDGATWTTYKSSTVAPSGSYQIWFRPYKAGAGFSEIYKIGLKTVGNIGINDVWLFAFVGESNSGGYAVNANLTAGELAARSGVQIWNNTTTVYEDLKIGVNNLISHAGLTDNATHGWENGLCHKVEDSTLPAVYLAKCGQGGSKIEEWEAVDAYYTTMIARIKANMNAIIALGKKPRLVVWFSIGINDMLASTNEAAWKAGVQALFVNIRNECGANTPIIMTEFMTGYTQFNDSIQDIATADNKTKTIVTTDATTYPLRNTEHWNDVGMKNMATAMVASVKTYYGI